MENQPKNEAMEWLKTERGLTDESINHLGLKAKTDNGEPKVGFPYQDLAGEVVGHKVRSTRSKKFWFSPSGVERDLFNLSALYEPEYQDQPVIITEGEMDVASIVESGFYRVVSIPDGWTKATNVDDEGNAKLRPVLDHLERFFKSPFCIFAGDNDEVGRDFAKTFQNVMDTHPVKFCQWPEGCKDANDVLVEYGVKRLVECINAAKPMDPEGAIITGLDDLPPIPDRTILRTGDPYLDQVFRLEVGTVNVVTGIPNHGKSTKAVSMLDACAHNENARVGAVMFETHPHQLRDQICRMETGAPYRWDSPRSIEGVRERTKFWRFVHPQEDANVRFDLDWLIQVVRNLAIYHDCKIVLLDPWNEITHMMAHGETETIYTREALAELRRQARKYGVAIVIVAHPRKMDPKDDRPVQGYDISGSSTWYDKVFMGWTVQLVSDEFGSETTVLHAWKVKDRSAYGIGPGSADFVFIPERAEFAPAPETKGAML